MHNSKPFVDFLIIGAQRCGTTSLYNYMSYHPKIQFTTIKELHFFDIGFNKGIKWYRSNFPDEVVKQDKGLITGEATPYYIFHPLVPQRIFEFAPKIKLIVLLRNPVDRAYSHYQHEVNMGAEKLSFEDALKAESGRLEGELDKIKSDETYYSFNHQNFSYLSRGIYHEQLLRWFNFFCKENILILQSENFYSNTSNVVNKVFEFLSLPSVNLKLDKVYNNLRYKSMKPTTREYLIDYFKPYNEKLYKLLDVDFKWDT